MRTAWRERCRKTDPIHSLIRVARISRANPIHLFPLIFGIIGNAFTMTQESISRVHHPFTAHWTVFVNIEFLNIGFVKI